MTSPSADRPLPEKIKSFTEEDVALVAEAIGSAVLAREALTALAAAGRLLPPDAEHREEKWRVVLCDPDGTPYAKGRHCDSRAEAVSWAEVLMPDPGDIRKIERRILGPWVEVENTSEEPDA